MSGTKLVNDAWTYFFKKCPYLYVEIRSHAPYFKAIRLFHSFKQFSKTKFFHHNRICNTTTLISVKSIILFHCETMKLCVPYLALELGELHRRSPITSRQCEFLVQTLFCFLVLCRSGL